MNATHHAAAFRPGYAEARFAPALQEPRREAGYSAASSYYSQRRYTGKAATPLFRCS